MSLMRDFCRYSTNVGDVVKDSETLSAPCGGTSPRVGGIAKAVLHGVIENEQQTFTSDRASHTISVTMKSESNCAFASVSIQLV